MTEPASNRRRDELTPKQRRFVEEYLRNGENAAAAYRAAYGTKASPLRCSQEAHRLLRHPKIAPIVTAAHERAEKATERVLDRYEVSKERIIAELARLGFANMQDYMRAGPDGDPYLDFSALTPDQAAALAEVTVEDFKDGRGEDARDVRRVKFKLYDKRAALVDLGRHLGLFKEKVELTGAEGGPMVGIGITATTAEDAAKEYMKLMSNAGGSKQGR